MRGEEARRQADIFAAVVFWELVTGRRLFGGANEQERMLKILAENYPAPSLVNAGLPAMIDRIAMRALHPDVASRYSSALEMAVDLENHLSPASQRVVSEWVQGLAAESLEARAELLQQIEVSHINSVPAPDSIFEGEEPTTAVEVGGPGFSPGRVAPDAVPTSARWPKVAVAAVLATLAIGAVVVLWPKSAPPPASASAMPANGPAPILINETDPSPAATTQPLPIPQDRPTCRQIARGAGSTKPPEPSPLPNDLAPQELPAPAMRNLLPDDLQRPRPLCCMTFGLSRVGRRRSRNQSAIPPPRRLNPRSQGRVCQCPEA